jgi:ABC-type transport system involved in cytochrome c biogenesis permease component
MCAAYWMMRPLTTVILSNLCFVFFTAHDGLNKVVLDLFIGDDITFANSRKVD